MIEENVEFLEAYKRLDNLVKDSLQSEKGVSDYISIMETERLDYKYEDYYKLLKHLRWIRNELSHKPETMKQDMCDMNDIDDVERIYNDFLNMNDPRSVEHRKVKQASKKNLTNNTANKIEPNSIRGTWIIAIIILLFITIIFMSL